jgi:predicted GNAT family acetyltransferase
MTAIAHDPARQRFTTEADGQAAYLEYERADGLMTITHTIVPPDIGGVASPATWCVPRLSTPGPKA